MACHSHGDSRWTRRFQRRCHQVPFTRIIGGLEPKPEEENMAHTPFVVFRDQGQWKIKSNDVHYGPYAPQRDAIRAVVDAAHDAGRIGLHGQVLLQDQFRTEWTYGKDPYPPNSSDYL